MHGESIKAVFRNLPQEDHFALRQTFYSLRYFGIRFGNNPLVRAKLVFLLGET